MPSITERKQRKEKSKHLRRARSNLLTELEQLENELCDQCKNTKGQGSSARLKCGCSASMRMREIGQELLNLTNNRTQIKLNPKEVKKVVRKNKSVELTEEEVNEMKAAGMTYAEIAKHFGISAPTLANRRQNWELERVRAQHQKEKAIPQIAESSKTNSEPKVVTAESSAAPPLPTFYETEITELKEAIIRKDDIIREQKSTIDQLKDERDELANRSEVSVDWQEEIKDERKLLAILLEREAARIKSLVEVV